jgi:OFA family oxalate/formate antiporter-like MFS transporter
MSRVPELPGGEAPDSPVLPRRWRIRRAGDPLEADRPVVTDEEATVQTRRGWVVVGASFVTMAIFYGIWYSYGVFFVAILRDLGWSRSLVAGAFSVFTLVHGASGSCVGTFSRRVGARRVIFVGSLLLALGLILTAQTTQWWHLYLYFAGVAALGIGLGGYVPLVVLVRDWFPRQVGAMTGLASAGIGVGICLVGPVSQFLIDQIGWRWTYRILALVVVLWSLPATLWLLRSAPAREAAGREGSAPDRGATVGGPYWTLKDALRTGRFWGLALAFMSGNVVPQMLFVHQVAFLIDHGAADMAAATVGGIAGLVSIPGKFAWGVFADRKGRELAYSLGFGCMGLSIGLLVLAGVFPHTGLPFLYAVVMGIGYAVTAPVLPAISSDLFGGPGFPSIFGVIHLSMGFGSALGAWGAGRIFDLTGSYAEAFWLATGLSVLSPAILWCVGPRRLNPPPGG